MIPIDYIVKVLDFQFEEMVKTFDTDTWKFYKFGNGGPYKRSLTRLTQFSNEMDPVIFKHFGIKEENASFKKLIILALETAKDDKKTQNDINTFRRQLKRMKEEV